MTDNTTRIAELRTILESGVTTITVAGTTTTVDLNQVRIELSRLMSEDTMQKKRRPRISSINLRGLM